MIKNKRIKTRFNRNSTHNHLSINAIVLVLLASFFVVSVPMTSTLSAKTFTGKPDLAREKRMASEVEDAVLDGEVIYLKDGDHEFMAIDTDAGNAPKGAVIILHGRGFHANWEDAVFPLRTQLPAKGWRTLSLQMPVLEKSAKYYDYEPLFPLAKPRIEAGIQYLKEQGIKNIVLLAHSCGAHMAMHWVRDQDGKVNDKISAYIGAGMGATDFGQHMKQEFPLDKLTIPVLDVFGSDEYPAVRSKAPSRLMQISKAANPLSKQLIIPKANHYFTDQGDALVNVVSGWLNTLPKKSK